MTDLPEPHLDGFVRVRGSRVHNLRSVDVDVPRDALTVFTGVSGSGKSSLAFGTLYAEAQRRYLESVAPYARRLIQQVGAPKVESVTGLPPAVALQQRRGAGGARSTVGTVTTLSNSLRMLYSRAGAYPPGSTGRLDSDAFSPNTVAGACPECHGLGRVHLATEESMVPDPSLTIRERAIASWPGAWLGKNLRDILATLGHDIDRPWRELDQADRNWILFTDEEPVVTVHPEREAGRIQRPYQGKYMSARRHVLHTLSDSRSATMRRRMLQYVRTVPCPVCDGHRLRPESLAVTFAGHSIADLAAMPLAGLAGVLRDAGGPAHPGPASAVPEDGAGEVAATLTGDLLSRIEVLLELGLGYLSMSRSAPTLSGGELQRLRLATALRSGLFGVVYVLDEPSAGLHPADAEPLLTVLDRLKAAGNSLFVVEHDMDVVRRADWVVDVGPGAGSAGGTVLHSGPVEGLRRVPASATRRFLFPDLADPADPAARADPADPADPAARAGGSTGGRREPTGWIRLSDVTRHNVRHLDAGFPLGVLTAVTGVSGSGKSTLVSQVLADVVAVHLGSARPLDAGTEEEGVEDTGDAREHGDGGGNVDGADVTATGLHAVDRLVQVDQKPIGRTPRSNLATYTGLFDGVRSLFAATDEARSRGWGAGRFSFNVAGGRCETCQGEGFVAVELLFLPGTYAPCPTCGGGRYAPETLEVTYRGRTIADVLDLVVDEAAEVFADVPRVARSLRTLQDVGLGYLHLGQPATELSGGEAQRIKLASELQRGRRGHTLYLLDEPTTGLHPADVEVLMAQLHGLVDAGNTVVVVEHDMGVVATADHVVDLGPGAGAEGGLVVAAGTPEQVAAARRGRTAAYLSARLGTRAR